MIYLQKSIYHDSEHVHIVAPSHLHDEGADLWVMVRESFVQGPVCVVCGSESSEKFPQFASGATDDPRWRGSVQVLDADNSGWGSKRVTIYNEKEVKIYSLG